MEEKVKVALKKTHAQAPTYRIEKDLKESLLSINALENLKKKGSRVLIKPNVASPGALYSTNPSVTYAAAKIFADAGFKVIIGENPSIPTNSEEAYGEYGLKEIAEKAGAELVEFRRGPHEKVKVNNGRLFDELEVSSYSINTDIIVSVAAMKSANIVTATLSVKNMKGVIPSNYKRKFHCEGLNEGISDLMKVVKPDLAIIDGTMGRDMTQSCCFPVGLLIVSEDALAADAVCSRIMGYDPVEIEHLRLVAEDGLGVLDEEKIEIIGEKLTDHMGLYPFSLPKDPFVIAGRSGGKINIVQGNPCCVCLNELGTVMHLFEDKIDRMGEVTILVGPRARIGESRSGRTVIAYGNCVNRKECDYVVEGCPPTDYREADTGSLIDVFNELAGLVN